MNSTPDVMRLEARFLAPIRQVLLRYGMQLMIIPDEGKIPGSFWGEPEAGLIANRLYARRDTPLHSILHEASHFICMDQQRRDQLDTDAGGDYDEENAVCYLQILLADELGGFGKERAMADMDSWGYTFRLGSARDWFENDAEDAREWLVERGILVNDDG